MLVIAQAARPGSLRARGPRGTLGHMLPASISGRRRPGERPPTCAGSRSAVPPPAPSEDVMLVSDPRQTTTDARANERELEGSAAHLLRLCLDLQLDALLLTLGALAVDTSPEDGPASDTSVSASGIPWRRWIGEDVDPACELAAAALAGNAALPPTLGSDLSHAVPVSTIDDLVARYSSMLGLLGDLSRRSEGTARPAGLDEALTRCEARLAELRGHRLVETPPSGLDLRVEQHYLPGELLG